MKLWVYLIVGMKFLELLDKTNIGMCLELFISLTKCKFFAVFHLKYLCLHQSVQLHSYDSFYCSQVMHSRASFLKYWVDWCSFKIYTFILQITDNEMKLHKIDLCFVRHYFCILISHLVRNEKLLIAVHVHTL